jgi:branched-chain amino acid transport system permease protein
MTKLFPHVPRAWWRYGLLAFLPLLAVLPLPDFWITQLNYIGLYSLVALGLVLLTGVGGLTSFGQAAFVGIGAYTSAYMTVNLGWSPWATIFVGMAICAVSALLVGWLTLRMSGHYLPLATIAWGLSLYYLMGNLEALGKYDGILGVPTLSLFGWDLGEGRPFFLLVWAMVLFGAFALINLLDSRTGRAIRALKSATQMAEAMGVNTLQHKVGIFLIAANYACVSGWLFAHFQRTVNPSPFSLKFGIEYLFMAVLGGVGHVWGAITGALFTKIMEDQLQVLLPKLIGTSGSYETIVFGIVLVLVLKYLPDGVWSIVGRHFPVPQRVNNWFNAEPLPERSKPAMGDVVLDVQKVRKQFGGLVAVNDITFQVKAGQIVGLDRSQRGRQIHHVQPGDGCAGPHLGGGEVPWRGHQRPPVTRDCHARHVAHLPAREDDPGHDRARKRGAGCPPAWRCRCHQGHAAP